MSARVKVGGRGTQGYSRHTLLGTGSTRSSCSRPSRQRAARGCEAKCRCRGCVHRWKGLSNSRSKRSARNTLRGKQADVRAQGLAQGRRASTCRSRLLHVGRGRGGRRHAPDGAAITQHHRCTETGDAHAQMANVQPAQSDVWGAWQCVCTGGRGCQILVAKSTHVRFHQSTHQRRREWQHKHTVCSKCHTR
jgi:hypothetical protein